MISEVTNQPFLGSKLVTNYYDENGYLIKKDLDKDGNGVVDGNERYYVYTYHKQGYLLTRSEYRVNGSIYTVEVFNKHGDLVKKKFDYGDGKFTQTSTQVNTYRDDGRKSTRTWDNYSTGEIANIIYYTYDGNKVIEKMDVAMNGTIDHVTTYTYDDKGDLIRRDRVGSRSIVYEYSYNDETGNLEMKTVDQFADGSRVTVTNYLWEERKILAK